MCVCVLLTLLSCTWLQGSALLWWDHVSFTSSLIKPTVFYGIPNCPQCSHNCMHLTQSQHPRVSDLANHSQHLQNKTFRTRTVWFVNLIVKVDFCKQKLVQVCSMPHLKVFSKVTFKSDFWKKTLSQALGLIIGYTNIYHSQLHFCVFLKSRKWLDLADYY